MDQIKCQDSKISCCFKDNGIAIATAKQLNHEPNNKVSKNGFNSCSTEIKLYKKRYVMLFLFSICSMLNGVPWIQYAILADVTTCYFGVDIDAINWTSLVYMIVFIPLAFPAIWIMENKGIKFTLLLGAGCNFLGGWVQCGSLAPDRFPVIIVSQTLYAIGQVFVLSLPPYIAAVWFGANEVALACAFGVFGNQLGYAIGFILPPEIVSEDCDVKDDITRGLSLIGYVMATVNSIIFAAIIYGFQEKPPKPPSQAQRMKSDIKTEFFKSIKNLMTDYNFCLLLFSYGVITGGFFAISTIMNEMVLIHFPGEDVAAGWLGVIFVLSGMAGSVVSGYLVDKTHQYKFISMIMFVTSFLTVVAYVGLIRMQALWLQFVLIFILGFFLTGYIPVGFDFAAEITYPESESVSASLLNISCQVFSIAMTMVATALLEKYGDTASNLFISACLLVSCITIACMRCELKRSKMAEIETTGE